MGSNYSILHGSAMDNVYIVIAYCFNPNWDITILKGWRGGKGTFDGG